MHGQIWRKSWQKLIVTLAITVLSPGKNYVSAHDVRPCLPTFCYEQTVDARFVICPPRRQGHPRHGGVVVALDGHLLGEEAEVGRELVFLHSHVKKSQATPDRDLKLARRRLKEVQS